ncbi:M23 family metallopeptidase [Aquisediminimonas sediminicola]|uniref:M23 family metallopeptidase n=1 Tax=Alteraquisediminimonas sediminicola TaxID=2676787 RepID=UPI001C8D37EF|nr:M23 family metallopeptidase [Aquisediminimonas sediminicola]
MFQSLASDAGQGSPDGQARPLSVIVKLSRADHWQHIRAFFHDLDLVVDLGSNIGSRIWWRGAATCTALCLTAYSLGPDLSTIAADDIQPMPRAHWEESRSLAIMPLATGADTGRRMAATQRVEMLADAPERPTLELTATIGQGDGFGRSLQRAGVAANDAGAVTAMIARYVPPADIRSGTRVNITLGRRMAPGRPRPLDYMLLRARFDLKLAIERVNGQLIARPIPIAVDNTPLRIQGQVGSGLYLSARAAGAPVSAVQSYIRAISQQVSVGSDIYADDRFDLIISHRQAETGEAEFGELLYAGLQRAGRKVQMVRWESNGSVQWFEASGVGQRRGMLRQPVNGHMTSTFGMRRHPLLGYNRFHRGVDFGAPYGAPIVAAADGVVQSAGRAGGYGLQVRIAHNSGLATSYSHMSRIAAGPGMRVQQGQVIGYVGSTGLSTGPHLHYELYRNGQAINPNAVSYTMMSQLNGAELARFRSNLSQLLAVRPGAAPKPKSPATLASATPPAPSRAVPRPGA